MAWPERHGKKWRGKYRDASGKIQIAGTARTKTAAKELAVREELKIKDGEWHDPRAGKMLFSTYFEEHWLPNRMREANTVATYQSNYNTSLKAAFGDMEIRKIHRGHVQRWVNAETKAGTGAATVHRKYNTLCAILGAKRGVCAVFDGLIAESPCHRIELPIVPKRKPVIYTPDECDLVLGAIDPWWRPIPALAADSGLRWGELMGLEVHDFTGDFQRLTSWSPTPSATGGSRHTSRRQPTAPA